MIYEFSLPFYVDLPRKTKKDKRVYLNLNVYRNLHHAINNQVKQQFKPLERPEFFTADRVEITYEIYPRNNRLFDTMNTVAIVDKYFCDWLVNEGYIQDDNYLIVSHGAPVIMSEKKGLIIAKVKAGKACKI